MGTVKNEITNMGVTHVMSQLKLTPMSVQP